MGKTVNIKDLREKGDIVLVVFKEHTLGYINLERPGTLAVLRACVWKGADWSSSPTVPLPPAEYKVRIATPKDFDDYNVAFVGYNNDPVYKYIYNSGHEPVYAEYKVK